MLSSRFYFIAYEVDSPLKLRYDRFISKYNTQGEMKLDAFVELDDKIKFNSEEYSLYAGKPEHLNFIRRKFMNNTDDIVEYHRHLRNFNFNDKQLVRPSFDTYFLRLAELAASRSNCMKRGNGAVISKDNRVVSTGYNGTPGGLTNCN